MYLELNDNEYLQLSFIQCYNIKFEHYFEYQKNIDYCKLKKQQIPYFIQNIEGEDLNIYDYIKYHIKIDMFPGVLELYCNSLNVKKVSGFVLGIE
ncbi:MAG: hypothetical protein IJS61_07730 [Firmicutes bacterium]|nr:hypothetical protein [Bacillota bacterium]